MPGTRKLGKTTDQRKAMLRQQVTDLLDMGRMETTVFRAKEIAPLAEKMITLGKKKDMAAYRQALAFITREDVAKKVFEEVAPKYADRNGGRDGCHRARVRSFRTPIIMHRPFCGRCIFFGCKKPRSVCSRCVFVFYRPALSVV